MYLSPCHTMRSGCAPTLEPRIKTRDTTTMLRCINSAFSKRFKSLGVAYVTVPKLGMVVAKKTPRPFTGADSSRRMMLKSSVVDRRVKIRPGFKVAMLLPPTNDKSDSSQQLRSVDQRLCQVRRGLGALGPPRQLFGRTLAPSTCPLLKRRICQGRGNALADAGLDG